MSPHSIIRTLAAAALIAVPSMAMAAPDQSPQNGQWNNGCQNGHWANGQCVANGQGNNANANTNHRNDADWQRRERERLDRERWEREHAAAANGYYNNGAYNNGAYNSGYYNNGTYNAGYGAYGNNGGYNNGRYGNAGNRGNEMTATVSSFSPYNLYLNNGVHVELHNGTVINPTGTNLTPGQRVRVMGYRNGDGSFTANEIDLVGGGYRY